MSLKFIFCQLLSSAVGLHSTSLASQFFICILDYFICLKPSFLVAFFLTIWLSGFLMQPRNKLSVAEKGCGHFYRTFLQKLCCEESNLVFIAGSCLCLNAYYVTVCIYFILLSPGCSYEEIFSLGLLPGISDILWEDPSEHLDSGEIRDISHKTWPEAQQPL